MSLLLDPSRLSLNPISIVLIWNNFEIKQFETKFKTNFEFDLIGLWIDDTKRVESLMFGNFVQFNWFHMFLIRSKNRVNPLIIFLMSYIDLVVSPAFGCHLNRIFLMLRCFTIKILSIW